MTDPDHDIPDHDIHNELNRFRPRPISEALRQRIREDVIAGGAARPLLERSPRGYRRLIAVIAATACLAVAIGIGHGPSTGVGTNSASASSVVRARIRTP